MNWPWRRKRQRAVTVEPVATGGDVPGRQNGTAWQVDQRPMPPVTWSQQHPRDQREQGSYDAHTDVFSVSAARSAGQLTNEQAISEQAANGRQGGQMPGIYCPRCGAPNSDNARFCSQCATPLIRADRATAGETTSMIFTGGEPAVESEYADQAAADAAVIDTLPPNTALLVVRRGPNEGSRFLLDSELTEVGRRPDSDIFLDDVTVSRRHAEFYRSGSQFTVRDVGSLNGTYVNKTRIEKEAPLNGGDEVQIGKFRMVFLQGRLTHAESGV